MSVICSECGHWEDDRLAEKCCTCGQWFHHHHTYVTPTVGQRQCWTCRTGGLHWVRGRFDLGLPTMMILQHLGCKVEPSIPEAEGYMVVRAPGPVHRVIDPVGEWRHWERRLIKAGFDVEGAFQK